MQSETTPHICLEHYQNRQKGKMDQVLLPGLMIGVGIVGIVFLIFSF